MAMLMTCEPTVHISELMESGFAESAAEANTCGNRYNV